MLLVLFPLKFGTCEEQKFLLSVNVITHLGTAALRRCQAPVSFVPVMCAKPLTCFCA